MYDEYHRDYREMLLSVSTKATRKDYENRGFCSFVVSNPHGVLRNLFFERLSKRKKVDSGGRYKNNIGGHLEDKKSFLSSYRFNICFENSSSPGYSTEKIIQAFSAKTIPIYWGDPSIATFFNREAFIDLREFKNFDDAIEYILRVDSSPDLWLKYVNSNPFVDSIDPKEYQDEWFLEQFEEKLEHSKVRGRVRKYSPLFMLYMFFQNVWLKYYQLIGPRTFLPYAKNVLAHLAKGKK
jgi:hypothetical protein